MIVGVCGLGYTGSGAVQDLLKEYEEIEDITGDFEFGYVYKPDGILDLKYHLLDSPCRDLSSNIAIKRFIDFTLSESGPSTRIYRLSGGNFAAYTQDFIDSICQIKWKFRQMKNYTNGTRLKKLEGRIRYRIQREFDSRLNYYVSAFPEENNYFSIKPDDFDIKAHKYIMNIVSSMRKDKEKNILLNQPFAGDDPVRSFEYFDDPYAIVVDRDPRDLYIMMKHICFSRGRLTDDVRNYITYYKKIRENIQTQKSEKVLRIQFEDLIYRYNYTVEAIEHFLEIYKHISNKKYFDPDISIQNTQLWNRYPQEKENIEIIEKELKPWIYSFEKGFTISNDFVNF